MTIIDAIHLKRLLDRGLLTSEPFPKNHGWEDGVRIGKPTEIDGNFIPEHSYKFMRVETNAPTVVLYARDNDWIVFAQDFNPTKGPGDFQNVWSSLEEAIDDILDFYFGDPARMQAKAEAMK